MSPFESYCKTQGAKRQEKKAGTALSLYHDDPMGLDIIIAIASILPSLRLVHCHTADTTADEHYAARHA